LNRQEEEKKVSTVNDYQLLQHC